MLTRLKIDGFKNLREVDVRLGTFTCIAGANGAGKSNLFDAIQFLAMLADQPLMEAACGVRAESDKTPDVRLLFRHEGETFCPRMHFEAEMLVPPVAVDDLGQRGKAKTTFLVYRLTLGIRSSSATGDLAAPGTLQILNEELTYVPKKEAGARLPFEHTREWRDSVVLGACRRPLISTEEQNDQTVIKLHQDGNQGRPSLHAAATLPRTVLSRASAAESPTALCARREMASWQLLQLEPSALRRPSSFSAPDQIGMNGAHLAAALYRIASREAPAAGLDADAICAQVANRLAELIGDVRDVCVDRDDKRELLTLLLKDRAGTIHPAQALSDGTLRFLALAVLELDPECRGTICLEEPENGIHPDRIPAMLRLLRDIAVDVEIPVDRDNPMRQVLVNTHSPVVVQEVLDASLLVAEADGEAMSRGVRFGCLPDTWRTEVSPSPAICPKGLLLSYLGDGGQLREDEAAEASPVYCAGGQQKGGRLRKIKHREDLQPLLPGTEQWP